MRLFLLFAVLAAANVTYSLEHSSTTENVCSDQTPCDTCSNIGDKVCTNLKPNEQNSQAEMTLPHAIKCFRIQKNLVKSEFIVNRDMYGEAFDFI